MAPNVYEPILKKLLLIGQKMSSSCWALSQFVVCDQIDEMWCGFVKEFL